MKISSIRMLIMAGNPRPTISLGSSKRGALAAMANDNEAEQWKATAQENQIHIHVHTHGSAPSFLISAREDSCAQPCFRLEATVVIPSVGEICLLVRRALHRASTWVYCRRHRCESSRDVATAQRVRWVVMLTTPQRYYIAPKGRLGCANTRL